MNEEKKGNRRRQWLRSKGDVYIAVVSRGQTFLPPRNVCPRETNVLVLVGVTLRARFTCVYATIMDDRGDALAHNLLLTTDSYKVSIVPTKQVLSLL